ncbi:MAG: GLUG motif-containing protein [Trichloromonadaceae bacterium]
MMRSSVTSRLMNCKRILAWQGFFVLLFLMIVPSPAVAQLANIALNKPLEAHTNVVHGTSAHAVDGDYNTGWYSYQGQISSISFTIDLLHVQTVYGYSLQSLQSEYYIIESSLDGNSWDNKQRVEFEFNDNKVRKFEFQEPFKARYIRYTGGNAQVAFAGITELEIFGARVFIVNSTVDSSDANPGDGFCADVSNNCTLRAAIMEMNHWTPAPGVDFDPSGEDYVIALPAGRYVLNIAGRDENDAATGDLDVRTQSIIVGEGGESIVDADGIDRVFHVVEGASLALRNLVVQGGQAEIGQGGGILNEGNLNLDRVLITKNVASYGGGISNNGNLTGVKVRIAKNMAESGGGIYNAVNNSAVINIAKSTIEENTAAFSGGGVDNAGNFRYYAYDPPVGGNLTLSNVTIAHNRADFGGGVALHQGSRAQLIHCTIVYNDGRGIVGNGAPSFDMFGSILAENKQYLNDPNLMENCYQGGDTRRHNADLNDSYFNHPDAPYGFNLSSDGSCYFSEERGGINSQSPRLSATPTSLDVFPQISTYVVTAGSPAIDAIRAEEAVVFQDIFGTVRPLGTGFDMGAFEATPVEAPVVFAGGNGSVENPYQIATAEQLDAVRDFLDKHFILTADIDLSEYASGEGWEPIGDANAPFSGSFDGNGHSITNLSINRPDRDHVGLFGNAEGAAFSNLNLQVEVVGDYRVGGLVGNLEPGSISDVHVSGTATGTTNEVGGLAGRIKFTDIQSSSARVAVAGGSPTRGGGSDLGGLIGNVQNGSSIVDCAAYGSISDHSVSSLRTGGLLGTLWDSNLERSFAAGDVVGRDNVGGLVGYNGRSSISNAFATGNVTPTANGITNYGGLVGSSDSGSTITNTYATGNVTGIDMVGGLIGRQTSDSSVTNSYAAGRVVGTTSNVGGLIGINYAGGVTSSYYDSTASGQSDTGKGEPKTTAELHQEATFTSWDFDATWKIIGSATTPYVKWQKYFVFGGTKVQISENVGGVKAGYILRPVGGDNPATRVQSTVAMENATSIEGLQGRWMAVTRAGSNEVRAVAATDAEGESRTWLEVFDAQTNAWEKVSSTLALDEDAFEAGNEIVIEEDAKDGLQMRIETKVTRELHF